MPDFQFNGRFFVPQIFHSFHFRGTCGPDAFRVGDWLGCIAEFAPRGANGGKGEFIVRLMVDTSRFTIEMTLDFDQGTTEFRTSVGEMGGSKRRFQRPPSLLRVLTPEFVPFFVFDGELAHALLDPKKTRAREALEVQFQLSSLNQFSRLMELSS